MAGEKSNVEGKRCVVTGGSGFVGQRLVEMLIERGAAHVASFDIAPKPRDALEDARIDYVQGDLRDRDTVFGVVEGADCVWHIAAAVGPYHPVELYEQVNYGGTVHVIDACRHHGCHKIVMSSSPSTRFDGSDVDGLTEAEMPTIPQKSYLQVYAETKAMGEKAMTDACDVDGTGDGLLTVAVAPHQVYGPRDNLFMPNILEAAGTGRLRVFGAGDNRVCFSHVDNYCHGLILAEAALVPGSAALGQFYIVTDGATHTDSRGCTRFWDAIDETIVGMGFPSIRQKWHLPYWLIMGLAYLCALIEAVSGVRLKLNPFSVRMLTMHRWFNIDKAQTDLGYEPIIPFDEGWKQTTAWFREHWLPNFDSRQAAYMGDIARQSADKIDLQSGNVQTAKKRD